MNKTNSKLLVTHHYLFQPNEALTVAPGVVTGGGPCGKPTWVISAKNIPLLKRIKSTF